MKSYSATCSSPSVKKAVTILSLVGMMCSLAMAAIVFSAFVRNIESGVTFYICMFAVLACMFMMAFGARQILSRGSGKLFPASLLMQSIGLLVLDIYLVGSYVSNPDITFTLINWLIVIVAGIAMVLALLLFRYTQGRGGKKPVVVSAVFNGVLAAAISFFVIRIIAGSRGSLNVVLVLLFIVALVCSEFALNILLTLMFDRKTESAPAV